MRIVRDVAGAGQYGGRFSGHVELAMLDEATNAERPDVARVTFHDGAVTNWHRHPGGQQLLLLEGHGRIGDNAGQHADLEPGVFVTTPADERHFHGAAPGERCVWLAITWGTTAWEDTNPDDADGRSADFG